MKIKLLLPMFLAVLGLIAIHVVLIVWFGVKLGGRFSVGLPWLAGGVLVAVGLHYLVNQIRGKGHGYSRHFDEHASELKEVENGPRGGFLVNLGHGFVEITLHETAVFRLYFYNMRKQARSVPRHATVKIETVRAGNVREVFDFQMKEKYLESTSNIPQPHEFKAIIEVSHGRHTHKHEVQF